MSAEFLDPGPKLAGVPDARRAPFPMLPSISYVYLALLLGIVPTCVLLFASAVALRRVKLALAALALALVGFFAPVPAVLAMTAVGGEMNYPLLRLLIRVVAVGLGFAAFKLAHPHSRGHRHLDGTEAPLLWVIGIAFASQFVVPPQLLAWLEFPLVMLGAFE